MPLIDKEKCNGCGVCITVCACHALVIVDDKATFKKPSHECNGCTIWCGNCELVCPNGAIECPFEIIVEKPDKA